MYIYIYPYEYILPVVMTIVPVLVPNDTSALDSSNL